MKKVILIFMIMFSMTQVWSQENKETRIPLLGEMAPSFIAQSTKGRINFPDDYAMKWKILFSHPSDFTPVCSSEIIELAMMQEEFEKLQTKLFVISTDGIESHIDWIKSLESIKYKGKKVPEINFPLISDKNLAISKKYGMIHSYTSVVRDVRGVFIIDPSDRIMAVFFYNDNVGRNMEEIKRTLLALQITEDKHVLTPANWMPGQDVLIPAPKTISEAEKLSLKKDESLYSLAWYLWFKKMK